MKYPNSNSEIIITLIAPTVGREFCSKEETNLKLPLDPKPSMCVCMDLCALTQTRANA